MTLLDNDKFNKDSQGDSTGDHIVHALLAGGSVRALAAVTTDTVAEAQLRHGLYPTAAAALGRVLTVTALLGAQLKPPQQVFVDIIADGPLGNIKTNVDAHGRVRGYVGNPEVHLPSTPDRKLNVGAAVGRGHLYVTRDFGLKESYRGYVPLVSGEIGEDFAYYFLHSEQLPSLVAVGVLVETDMTVRAAGGLIIQLMPEADEDVVTHLEAVAARLPAVSTSVDEGMTAEDLIRLAADGLDVDVLHRSPVRFECRCSRSRFERALISLGKDELEEMLLEDGQAELVCHFCSAAYHFTDEQLAALIEETAQQSP